MYNLSKGCAPKCSRQLDPVYSSARNVPLAMLLLVACYSADSEMFRPQQSVGWPTNLVEDLIWSLYLARWHRDVGEQQYRSRRECVPSVQISRGVHLKGSWLDFFGKFCILKVIS